MFILMPVIFVLGILAIALEDKIKINKAAIALFMAISMWMILMFDAYNIFVERSSTIFQEFLTQNPEMASLPPHEQFINFFSAMQFAQVAPTFPAPTTVTFISVIFLLLYVS